VRIDVLRKNERTFEIDVSLAAGFKPDVTALVSRSNGESGSVPARDDLTAPPPLATLARMVRRNDATPTDDGRGTPGQSGSTGTGGGAGDAAGPSFVGPDLAAFPVLGLTRRRIATILGGILVVWIVVVFARQVSEASAASGRAGDMIAANAARRSDIADLQRELDLIAQKRYIVQQARGYGLGSQHEIPFTLDPEAPPLGPDAPGSEALRVGASVPVTPLERWLTLLFGPGG
jgi:hypothetical protein